jgi:hypothetical protein
VYIPNQYQADIPAIWMNFYLSFGNGFCRRHGRQPHYCAEVSPAARKQGMRKKHQNTNGN